MMTLPVATKIKTTVMLSEGEKKDLRSPFTFMPAVNVTFYKKISKALNLKYFSFYKKYLKH
jgi:hypothetical protein